LEAAGTWVAGTRIAGVVPDEATYIGKRRHTGAIQVCVDLAEIVQDIDIARDSVGRANVQRSFERCP
jgi:hypothetical protein